MAALLTALLVNPTLHPSFAEFSPALPTFEYSIFVAGFKSVDAAHASFFPPVRPPIQSKTLHVLGRGDSLVGDDRSRPLVESFANSRVEWHDGGHHVPAKASWRAFFKEYFESRGDPSVVSPSDRVGSGASTPIGHL